MGKHISKQNKIFIAKMAIKHGRKHTIDYMIKNDVYEIDKIKSLKWRSWLGQRIVKYVRMYNEYGDKMYPENKIETRGRNKNPIPIDDVIDDLEDWEKDEILRHYFREKREKENKKKMKDCLQWNVKQISLSKIFGFSISGIRKRRKYGYIKSKRNKVIEQIITKTFYAFKGIYGHRRINMEISKKHGIILSDRTIANYMLYLGLKCKIRKKRLAKESKISSTKIPYLIKRDWGNKNSRHGFTDVTYIPTHNSTYYLSATICGATSKITSWNISSNNDAQLVIGDVSKSPKFDILNSDQGSQYFTIEYRELVKNKGTVQSVSHRGNSLDNRPIEYFFSNLKSECLKLSNYKKMSLIEIKQLVSKYINFYNYKRMSLKTKMTPHMMENHLYY